MISEGYVDYCERSAIRKQEAARELYRAAEHARDRYQRSLHRTDEWGDGLSTGYLVAAEHLQLHAASAAQLARRFTHAHQVGKWMRRAA